MSDEREIQRDTPGRDTTNTPASQGPEHNRAPYYGGRADGTIPQPQPASAPKEWTQGYDIVDQEVLEHVRLRLREHPDIDASRIWISHHDGVTTLSGTLLREGIKEKVEEIVRKVPEVKEVRNQLTVVPRGLDNQPPHGCGNVGGGMEVLGSDGAHIGQVKEVRVDSFLVIRDGAPDVYVPFDACSRVEDERVYLNIAAGQVAKMDWGHPEPFTAVP